MLPAIARRLLDDGRRALAQALDPDRQRLHADVRALLYDADCDAEGSLAQGLERVRSDVADLRARIDEWEPGRAADEISRQS
jgi:hypothetical protein